MALIADTGAIYAIFDNDDPDHQAVMTVAAAESAPLIVPMALLAEIDYLLSTRLGQEAADDFLTCVEIGSMRLEALTSIDVSRCRELLLQYRDLRLGLADASVMATAERLQVQTILTLDERHFRVVRPRVFPHFILYPADYPNGN